MKSMEQNYIFAVKDEPENSVLIFANNPELPDFIFKIFHMGYI